MLKIWKIKIKQLKFEGLKFSNHYYEDQEFNYTFVKHDLDKGNALDTQLNCWYTQQIMWNDKNILHINIKNPSLLSCSPSFPWLLYNIPTPFFFFRSSPTVGAACHSIAVVLAFSFVAVSWSSAFLVYFALPLSLLGVEGDPYRPYRLAIRINLLNLN